MPRDLDIGKLPGLKASQIKPGHDGRPVAEQGPIFYRVTIGQYVFDAKAIERQAGFERFMGNPVLAAVMGPDEDMAKQVCASTVFVGSRDAAKLPILMLLNDEGGE